MMEDDEKQRLNEIIGKFKELEKLVEYAADRRSLDGTNEFHSAICDNVRRLLEVAEVDGMGGCPLCCL